MAAKYILAALSVVFLSLAAIRFARAPAGTGLPPQAKTWLLVGVIFGGVSAWLLVQQS